MRQFGLDFRFRRPGWRRWRWRTLRFPTLCELLERFYPGVTFLECGIIGDERFRFAFPPGEELFQPGRMPGFREVPVSFTGPGCPQILSRAGFIGQDPLAVSQFRLAGIPIPTPERSIRFGWAGGQIIQLRFKSGGGIDARQCNLGLNEDDGREVVAVWDSIPLSQLQEAGFT